LAFGLAFFALFAPVARAAELTVGIVGLDAVEVSDAKVQGLTEVLRQRAASVPGVRVMPGTKELVELKLIFGCMDESPSCLAVAGRSLGADRLLYGSVRKAQPGGGPAYTVVLKQLDVATGQVDRFISDVVPARVLEPRSPELGPLCQRWLDVLLLSELHGGLRIHSEPPGAEVTLDGAAIGKTPIDLPSVPTGSHVAVISHPGYAQRGGAAQRASCRSSRGRRGRTRTAGTGPRTRASRSSWRRTS
jgi:hypothetical protein